MTLVHRKPFNPTTMESKKPENGSISSKKPFRRCRQAFTAVYFTRILTTLAQNVVRERTRILNRNPSYIALTMDLEPENNLDLPFFSIDQNTLTKITHDKNLQLLSQIGGSKQLALALSSNSESGIRSDTSEIDHRVEVFGSNSYPKPPKKRFFSFLLEALKDVTVLILLGCALLSLGFGIKQHGIENGWYDGGSIVIAIILVVSVSAISNFKQSRQFDKLSDQSGNIKVEVVRDGRRNHVSIYEVVVGDVVCLKIGDQVPADGVFLEGYSLKIDESSMTGESDELEVNIDANPFLLSGTKVTDGYCTMLVTSVGMNTSWGKMMSSISRELDEETPLQARLNKLTSEIGKLGLLVAFLVLVVMLVRYFMGHSEFRGKKTRTEDVINSILNIVSISVTIVVVAIPEGLPLAVTLTLAYSMKKMMADNAMVRKLSACETMGSATTICTDKTGTLTMNRMKVIEFWVGKEEVERGKFKKSGIVYKLLCEGVCLNTTGSVYYKDCTSDPDISGSPTEKALLSWGVSDLGMVMEEIRRDFEVLHVEAFNSEKKRSCIVARRKRDGCIEVHWKGAAEMIVAMCSHYCDHKGTINVIDDYERRQFVEIIQGMAAKSLRCIAFAYKTTNLEDDILDEGEMVLIGIVGLKDPCRDGVKEAVESCRNAGVNVKMVTGDNVFTARAIAIECGILNPSDDSMSVVEGKDFRSYTDEERMARVENIRVMARSSPFDKLLMVRCLKKRGHVVAVTGDGTNDAPALKEADIGLSMGIQGTEVAKESSDIVILDDNFASVVTVTRWGRCVYSNIQKFIQFQLTVNVAALVINFVAAVSSGNVPLTAVQLLWVNLIMDTLGALALATEQPTNDLMKKPPAGRTEPLVTRVMWRNLTLQAVYQVVVLLTLQFKGESIFGVGHRVKDTLIFNCFVFCQVFNEFNARELEKKNIFKGILKNKLFLGIVGVTVVLQVIMVEFLKRFANTERLNWGQWGACITIAVVSWPIGWLAKCIPVE